MRTVRSELTIAARVLSAVVASIVLSPAAAAAHWLDTPPALPAPTGRVVNVSTEAQLQSAISGLTSGTTIMIAPGTYNLTKPLYIKGPLSNITVRGSSNYRDDVVLKGQGRDVDGATPYGIWLGGTDLKSVTIANLTVRDVFYHPIIMNYESGGASPRVYNVHLINGGQQLMKTNPSASDATVGIDNGIVEYSVFEYVPYSRDWYANAVQVLAGKNWIIRNNLIKNIRTGTTELAGAAVLSWFSAGNTTVEGNTFINCQREIALGLIDRTPNDNTGGIVRNNFIYRDASVVGADVGIGVFDSPNSKVLNNTIILNGTYRNAIEYRFAATTGTLIANNLTDGQIAARDGGTATLQNNVTTATASMFVNAAAGDLHLQATATAAIDKGTASADVPTDWDGQARPVGSAPDIGADERSTQTTPPPPAPSAPTNVRIIK